VIAEGVESEAQAAHLNQLECGLGQGYFYFRTLECEVATELLLSQ
jgi:EAL domain-containing protein (putative c-di-GMP-specific phosphodiesterase class I)